MSSSKKLTSDQIEALLNTLKARFAKHPQRHPGVNWAQIEGQLRAHPETLYTLQQMEDTDGEPDVVSGLGPADKITFVDCVAESPKGRRSFCYDRQALEGRKENKPQNSALDLAQTLGVELLTETEYRHLQTLGQFDLKTSSWILTPPAIRKLGGALFCDRRYDHTFVYHNGAESYYAARGFRAKVEL